MTTTTFDLSSKTALVTGGSRGIGRAIADALSAAGAAVTTCGRGERPGDLPQAIGWVTADVSLTAEANRLRDHLGSLDVLVNNAGIQIEKTVIDTTDADWDLLMGANARGVFNMCRALIPVMRHGGSIINIGSVSGNTADPGLALYNASKAFVHGLTRSVAVDHGPDIRCNAICPGWIMTAIADAAFSAASDPAAARRDALSRHPAGRFGTPTDIANMALWLASDASAFATGQCYVVDGGLMAASPLNPALF